MFVRNILEMSWMIRFSGWQVVNLNKFNEATTRQFEVQIYQEEYFKLELLVQSKPYRVTELAEMNVIGENARSNQKK